MVSDLSSPEVPAGEEGSGTPGGVTTEGGMPADGDWATDRGLVTEGGMATGGGWRGAAALLSVVFFASVTNVGVLLAIPFLLLVGAKGMRGGATFVAVLIAMLVTVSGVRDGVWFIDRAWAVLLGGCFVALSLARPASKPATRALLAVFGAAAVMAGFVALRAGAWSALDWAISDRAQFAIAQSVEGVEWLRGGEALAPALVLSMYDLVEVQMQVFPAMMGVASMAALCVVWWVYALLTHSREQGLGPLKDFRFNDQLVWILVGGLLFLVTHFGEPLGRVGANAVVFVGALCALRGTAVVVFMSGGVSLIGFFVTAVGLLFVPKLLLGAALVIGLGDVYLDVRGHVAELAA
jgi:hypothetical protein